MKILENIKKINKSKLLVAFILFMLVFLIHHNVKILEGDDTVNRAYFNDIHGYIIKLFTQWSGRIVLFIILVIMLNINIIFFKIFNSIVILLFIYAVRYIVLMFNDDNKEDEKSNKLLFFTLALFLMMPIPMMQNAVLWLTGSFNYLVPTTALFITIIPFIKIVLNKQINMKEYLLYVPIAILAANTEQTSAILVCFSTIMLIMNKFKIKKSIIFYYIFIVVLSIIFLNAPGNVARLDQTYSKHIHDFAMFSGFDKIYQGTVLTLNSLINKNNFIIIVLSLLVFINICKSADSKKYEKIISGIPFIYILLSKLPVNNIMSVLVTDEINYEFSLDTIFYKFNYYGDYVLPDIKAYIPMAIGLFMMLGLWILIFFSFKNKKQGFTFALLYMAGVASSVVLGFSPTMFASGDRIFFVQTLINILICIALWNNIAQNDAQNENKLCNTMYYLTLITGIIMIATYY